MTYNVIDIPPSDLLETLGTKEKYWTDDGRKLFKFGRPNTGENWTEKVSYELTMLFGIPSASYELARCGEREGVLSDNFILPNETLIHANELLHQVDDEYDKDKVYKHKRYQLHAVLSVVSTWSKSSLDSPDNCETGTAIACFIGYLVFDAWIGNQDRHHENWGVIFERNTRKFKFAPSYDHASCMAFNISDEERKKRLTTKDKGYSVEMFSSRAKTPFYNHKEQRLTTFATVELICKLYPKETNYWLDKLRNVDFQNIHQIFLHIPKEMISHTAIEFSMKYLEVNRTRLLQLKVKTHG